MSDVKREYSAEELTHMLPPERAEYLAECTRLWAVCKRHDAVELLLAGPVRMHITAMCKPEGARMNKSVRRGSPPCRHGFNIWGEKVADCKPWCDRKPEGGK